MINDGTQLEKFVTKFHEAFCTESTNIETRKKLYANGICCAEIDILITDKFSSVPIQIAIECRDRKETEGADWIQQIIGRKCDFKFDKYIAVSSSGFSKPAIDLAKRHNILLRTTSDCSTIIDDFSLKKFSFSYPKFMIHGLVKIATHNKLLQNLHCNDGLFKKHYNDDYSNIFSFAIKNMPQYIDRDLDAWQSVSIDLPGDVFFKNGNKEYIVNHLRINGVYRLEKIMAQAIGIKTFNEDDKCLGQQVRIFAPYPEGAWVDFLFIRNDDNQTYTFNVLDSKFPSDIKFLKISI